MSDVMVKCGTMRPITPSGQLYNRIQLNGLVDGRAEVIDIDSGSGKVLIIDGDAISKGKMPNLIATGWLSTAGIVGHVAGIALLVDPKNLEPSIFGERRHPKSLYTTEV